MSAPRSVLTAALPARSHTSRHRYPIDGRPARTSVEAPAFLGTHREPESPTQAIARRQQLVRGPDGAAVVPSFYLPGHQAFGLEIVAAWQTLLDYGSGPNEFIERHNGRRSGR